MSRTGIFAGAKGAILGQTLSLLSSGIKVMPLTSLYVPDFAAHATLTDVPSGARVVAGVALTSKTLVQAGTGYRFDADDTAFGGIPNPTTIAGVVMYLDGGSDAASKLIGYFDYFVNTPRLVVSGTVTFSWPSAGIFILDDGVLGGPQGASGSLASVADDVAKHTGITIDTVQGHQGIPFRGYTRGVAPVVGAVATYHAYAPGGAGYEAKKPTPGGWYDVTNYGAKGDGSTDDADAIERAIVASGAGSAAPVGGVVYFPFSETGVGTYYCSRNIHVNRAVHLRGAGYGGFYTQSRIKFAVGCGFIFDSEATDAIFRDGPGATSADWVVENLNFVSDDMILNVWQPSHAYAIGDKVRVANDNRYYFLCTNGGTSGADRPFRDELDPVGILPNQGKELHVQTSEGAGALTWICLSASPIVAFARGHIRHCHFYRAPNAAVMFFGSLAYNGTDVNSSSMRDCFVDECGCGPHFYGNDANAIRVSNVMSIGNGIQYPSETGGFGFVDFSFIGLHFEGPYTEANTGQPFFGAPSKAAFSTIVGGYIEGAQPVSNWRGAVFGGTYGSNFNTSDFVTGFFQDYWHNIHVKASTTAAPSIRFDGEGNSFLFRLTVSDLVNAGIAERFIEDTTAYRGYWVTSSFDGSIVHRIRGLSQQQAVEGAHHARTFVGEFRGDTNALYYVAYDTLKDPYVRMGALGVGGHYLPGDKYEAGDPTAADLFCLTEGWATPNTWAVASAMHVWTEFYRLKPSSTVEPTTPNGYTYACTKTGTTHASTEPTWPTTMLGGVGGRYAPRWITNAITRIGEYRRPSTPNGHYYKATATALFTAADTRTYPNVYGEGCTAATEPTWPTGGGSTVTDGGIVWTEQGSDAGAFVTDGTTEWQCLGPKPVWRTIGSYSRGSNSTLQSYAGANSPTAIVADTVTSDATPTVVASDTIADGTVVKISVSVTAIKSDHTAGAGYTRSATFRRNTTVAQIGSTNNSETDEDASAWDVTLAFSGTSWQLLVTGAAATQIRWSYNVTIHTVGY